MEDKVKEQVCSFKSLYKALMVCKRNVMWKDSTAGYVHNSLLSIYALRQSLINDKYKIDNYTIFTIYEPKKRVIVSTRLKDRVFQRSLCDNYFYRELTKTFIYDNCACQIGKGTDFALNRLSTHLHRYFRKYGCTGYVLKCDIKDYFGSTRHDVAKEAIAKSIKNEWVLEHINNIIDSFNQGEDPDKGMGLGSQVTQLIQLAVLNGLDHFIKEKLKIKYYVRYMDDFLLIHPDKYYLVYCKDVIHCILESLNLHLNTKKTQIFKLSQPIHFLGFAFYLTSTGKVIRKILPKRISHERRKLRKQVNRAKQGLMSVKAVDDCFDAWKAHAKRGNCYNLIRKMEEYYKNLWEDKYG